MDLKHFKKHLQTMDNPQSTFLSQVSREMKSNLDGILGFSQLLASQRPGRLNSKQNRYISEIYENGKQLDSLINDYIDLARIESGMLDLNLTSLDFSQYILWALDVLAPAMNSKKLSFTVFWSSPTENIMGDATRIKQILYALLSKAIDFSMEGERLLMDISFREKSLKVCLENDPDKDLEEKLSPASSGSTPEKCVSAEELAGDLSLALAGKLIHLHGGQLGLDYDDAGRSYLWFTLHKSGLASNETVKPQVQTDQIQQQKIPRILLIDDSSNIQNLVSEIFRKEHYKVFLADNGKSGLEMARQCHPDLIFMDINMPVMNGTETIKELRTVPEFKGTPVVALTAEDLEESGKFLLSLGFDHLVNKPFSRSDILNCVLNYFPIKLQ